MAPNDQRSLARTRAAARAALPPERDSKLLSDGRERERERERERAREREREKKGGSE